MNMNLNLYNILQNVLNENVSQQDAIDALNSKRVVMITYNDEKANPPLGKRWIEPCSLVDMNGHGKLALRAYAYNGASRRGEIPDWRLFRLDRIQSWQPTNAKFTKAPDNRFNPMVINNIKSLHKFSLIMMMNYLNEIWTSAIKIIYQLTQIILVLKLLKKQPSGPRNINLPQQTTQSGAKTKYNSQKQKDWHKYSDLLYQQKKREAEKAKKYQQQVFGDEEEEMLNQFDNGRMFDNNDF